MFIKKLPWENLSWDNFESMSLHFAEVQIPDCKFERFLKQGNKQDGIDLISSALKDGQYITLQCKNVKEISIADLNKIVSVFLTNQFKERTLIFILVTQADLQNAKLQNEIIRLKKSINDEYKSEFLCWDVNFLSEQLRSCYSLVATYFSIEIARAFCFTTFRLPGHIPAKKQTNYTPRLVRKFSSDYNFISYKFSNIEKPYPLEDIFLKHRLSNNKTCLIGDAHQGKSFLLKQLV